MLNPLCLTGVGAYGRVTVDVHLVLHEPVNLCPWWLELGHLQSSRGKVESWNLLDVAELFDGPVPATKTHLRLAPTDCCSVAKLVENLAHQELLFLKERGYLIDDA